MVARLKKKSRKDQQRERKEALIKAGLRVVAKYGYTKASVQRITSVAGLAQGTFYSYFDSHDGFLNDLLPAEGIRFFRWLDEHVTGTGDFFEDQRAHFLAVSRYLHRNRHLLRLITDAECAAPESYAQHMRNVEQRSLETYHATAAQLKPHTDEEFRVISTIMSGVLGHIAIGCAGQADREGGPLPEWVADTYVRFLRHGLDIRTPLPDPDLTVPAPDLPAASPTTRSTLLDAAARVVMERGFAGANVTVIAQEAGLSVGALYAHFESRQELFDKLVDHVRLTMLAYVREFTRDAGSFIEREYRGFCAFFRFLAMNPWYIRVESEAAVWAPETYNRHFRDLADSYVGLLRRARASGEFASFEDRELPILAYIFMAARHYIAARYVPAQGTERYLPPHVSQVYLRLLQEGLMRR